MRVYQTLMIIVCPACETRYDLPENAVGPEGRTLRCAQCRHSWFQPAPDDGEAGIVLAPEEPAPAGEIEDIAADEDPGLAPPPVIAPDQPDVAVRPAQERPSFEEPATLRRGQLWLLVVLAFVLMAAAIAGALAFYGAPEWLPFRHTAIGISRQGLALDFPANTIERKTLADGTEFFGAKGTVTNTDTTRRQIPPIEIVLRGANKRIVYRWEVVPPKSQLGPGESMTITEAVTDIPRDAIFPEIGWKAG